MSENMEIEIFPGSVVKALGVNGETLYFRDILGQVLFRENLDSQFITMLFGGNIAQICDAFPVLWSDPFLWTYRKPIIGRFNQSDAREAMIRACFQAGIVYPGDIKSPKSDGQRQD